MSETESQSLELCDTVLQENGHQALAGCAETLEPTDQVEGVAGVGSVTKRLAGRLGRRHQRFSGIVFDGAGIASPTV